MASNIISPNSQNQPPIDPIKHKSREKWEWRWTKNKLEHYLDFSRGGTTVICESKSERKRSKEIEQYNCNWLTAIKMKQIPTRSYCSKLCRSSCQAGRIVEVYLLFSHVISIFSLINSPAPTVITVVRWNWIVRAKENSSILHSLTWKERKVFFVFKIKKK